jgi:ABC-type uncharacterized transport system permease subunit
MILSFAPSGNAAIGPWLLGAFPGLLAFVAYVAAALRSEQSERALRILLTAGWVAHAAAIAVDASGWATDESAARFGFAPALSVTLWLVLAVYLVESRFLPMLGMRRGLALLGAVAVALSLMFPGALLHPSVSRWAPLHWVLGMSSYALFGVAVLHAVLLNRADRQMRQRSAAAAVGVPLLRLERLTFRLVEVGFAVLTLALVLGAWFANPWRWDHKTVFSLLGWAVFAALLAGRHAFGWRGPRAMRWVYAGAGLLLLGYAGSRFVLEVVLQRPLA